MERLGTVSRTAAGVAVVRLDDDDRPEIGREVVDESLSTAGRVVDVFGPVARPYVAVSAAEGRSLAGLLGTKLYVR